MRARRRSGAFWSEGWTPNEPRSSAPPWLTFRGCGADAVKGRAAAVAHAFVRFPGNALQTPSPGRAARSALLPSIGILPDAAGAKARSGLEGSRSAWGECGVATSGLLQKVEAVLGEPGPTGRSHRRPRSASRRLERKVAARKARLTHSCSARRFAGSEPRRRRAISPAPPQTLSTPSTGAAYATPHSRGRFPDPLAPGPAGQLRRHGPHRGSHPSGSCGTPATTSR